MGAAQMKPYTHEDGSPAPERDYRPVPPRLMALYLGINTATLWRRVCRGMYRDSIEKIGGTRYFKPRKLLGIDP
jgi:hypothetical protein